ncbi:MAG: ATP-dependent helicase, partial [Colwellia sp.]|nr:ATP-dependent helicase [Colwellia sp.]
MLGDVQISEDDIDTFLASYNAVLPEGQQPLEFDEVRRAALIEWNDLQACPGSGKTTLIAAKLMILARKWKPKYQGICVLTHTNVACNEIRSRLEVDADGYKLLSYPHFIGTIQEFINRYIGLPIARSLGLDLRLLSSDEFEQEFNKIRWGKFSDRNTAKQYWFNYYLIRKKIVPATFSLTYGDDGLAVNPVFKEGFDRVINFDKGGTVEAFLFKKKQQYLKKGVALYKDMYAFSKFLVSKNSNLLTSLRTRFPKVLIDEMQDTQKFQDELINSIFESGNVNVQRFGDPDQAIFDNMGGEEPNETFNKNNQLAILAHSYRFSVDIAQKVSNLSCSQIGEIQALAMPDDPLKHTV